MKEVAINSRSLDISIYSFTTQFFLKMKNMRKISLALAILLCALFSSKAYSQSHYFLVAARAVSNTQVGSWINLEDVNLNVKLTQAGVQTPSNLSLYNLHIWWPHDNFTPIGSFFYNYPTGPVYPLTIATQSDSYITVTASGSISPTVLTVSATLSIDGLPFTGPTVTIPAGSTAPVTVQLPAAIRTITSSKPDGQQLIQILINVNR
jgi:hypothetical protein